MDLVEPKFDCELSPESFARFADFITGELGIKMPESKITLVQSRLLRRIRELQFSSLSEYERYFFGPGNDAERDEFISAITTNKTDFFREPTHFDFLVGTVLPELFKRGLVRDPRLKVWSAGCSTGKEPYTLAMVLREYMLYEPGFDFAILGTDVSPRVLAEARIAIYHESDVIPVPLALRTKYLLRSRAPSDNRVRIIPDLRRRASFHQLNFMDSQYMIADMFHVIFLRNVLIYFERATQEAVVSKLCRHLLPGGYLFIGHSESLTGMNLPLVAAGASVFRKISGRESGVRQ